MATPVMSLWSLIESDLRSAGVKEAKTARRLWNRAILETLHDRAITGLTIPRRRLGDDPTKVRTERYKPFWWAIPDQDLHEAAENLARHKRNL